MLQPIYPPLALVCLLVGLSSAAQVTPAGSAAPRSVVLTGTPGEEPWLHLAPGTLTVLLLDAPIVRESVKVEGRDRFTVLDARAQSITLSLAEPLGPQERLKLRFTYREGFPSSVVFLLTGQLEQVDTVVNVSRPPQSVEACRVDLAATRERCEAQAREPEESKACPLAVSPATVALADFVDFKGMTARDFLPECRPVRGELRPVACKGLGASTWSVVVLEVSNTGAEPWAPAWAEVTPIEGGEPRRARAVLPEPAASPPGGAGRVVVEVEMPVRKPEEWLRAPHALRVCNADGSRCLFVPLARL